MASSAKCNGGGVEENAAELTKPLKEGERILAPTRRPDGTLRKPIRIRAGYTPQEEVAIYQPKGALMRKEMGSLLEVPPGYVPVTEAMPKSKSAKRNERKKEKRQQVSVEKGKALEKNEISSEDANNVLEPVESVASQMNGLNISEIPSLVAGAELPFEQGGRNMCNISFRPPLNFICTHGRPPSCPGLPPIPRIAPPCPGACVRPWLVAPPSNSTECLSPVDHIQDMDKKIRALKKKIRQTEAQQQKNEEKNPNPQQLEKLSKLESWREELKLLEYKKAELAV